MKLFSNDLIKINVDASNKQDCLEQMVHVLHENSVISSFDGFLEVILAREESLSTGIGRMVAIPHARGDFVNELKAIVFILNDGLDFDSLDGKPVRYICMVAVPDDMQKAYMKAMGKIAHFFGDPKMQKKISSCNSVNEVFDLIDEGIII